MTPNQPTKIGTRLKRGLAFWVAFGVALSGPGSSGYFLFAQTAQWTNTPPAAAQGAPAESAQDAPAGLETPAPQLAALPGAAMATPLPSAAIGGPVAAPGGAVIDAPRALTAAQYQQAIEHLTAKGVITGPTDKLVEHLFTKDGQFTHAGEKVFDYSQKRNASRDLREYLEALRKGSPASDKKRENVAKALAETQKHFGKLSEDPGYDECPAGVPGSKKTSCINTAIEAGVALKAAEVDETENQEAYRTDLPNGLIEVTNGRGELMETRNKNGVAVWRRDLAEQQQKMAEDMTPCQVRIPKELMGKQTPATLNYGVCQLDVQLAQLDKQFHFDRTMGMAMLVNKRFQQDQVLKDYDHKLEAVLAEEKAWDNRKAREHVDHKFEVRKRFLEAAKAELEAYRAQIAAYKGNVIAHEDSVKMMEKELVITKNLFLAMLETKKYPLIAELERLDYDVKKVDGVYQIFKLDRAPLSEDFRKSLKLVGLDEAGYMKNQDKMAAEFRRLLNSIKKVKDLLDVDGPDFTAKLKIAEPAFQSLQRELREVVTNQKIYQAMPYLLKEADDQSGNKFSYDYYDKTAVWGEWMGMVKASRYFDWGAKRFNNKAMTALATWTGRKTYLGERDAMARYTDVMHKVALLARDGNFDAARKALIDAEPDAIGTHFQPPFGEAGEPVNDLDKVDASLKKMEERIGGVRRTHMYSGIVINTLAWSAALAATGPAAGALLMGAARGVGVVGQGAKFAASLGKTGPAWARYTGGGAQLPFQMASKVIENPAHAIWSLNASASRLRPGLVGMAQNFGTRGVNAAARISAFHAMSGTFTSVFFLGDYILDIQGSPYASLPEAMKEGALLGMQWSSDSWHPMIAGFVGLPSNIFEGSVLQGTRVTRTVDAVANAGPFSWSWTGANWLGRTLSRNRVIGGLGESRRFPLRKEFLENPSSFLMTEKGWQTGVMFPNMIDNYLKYYAFGKVGEIYSRNNAYYFDKRSLADGDNYERRLLRSNLAAFEAMDNAYWMFLPVMPAINIKAGAAGQRVQQGMLEATRNKTWYRLANAGDGSEHVLSGKLQIPLMQRMLNYSIMQDTGYRGKFTLDPQTHAEASRKALVHELGVQLKESASGTNRNLKPGDAFKTGKIDESPVYLPADPKEVLPEVKAGHYFQVSRLEGGKEFMVGRLHVGDKIPALAFTGFSKKVLADLPMAEEVLNPASVGRVVQSFGEMPITKKIQDEVALVIIDAKEKNVLGRKASSTLIERANQLMKVSMDLEVGKQTAAKAFHEARAKVGPMDKQSAAFKELAGIEAVKATSKTPAVAEVKGLLAKMTTEWKNKPGDKTYPELIGEFETMINNRKVEFSPAEHETLLKSIDFLRSIEKHFHYHNRTDRLVSRLAEGLELIKQGQSADKTAVNEAMGLVRNWASTRKPDQGVDKTWGNKQKHAGTLREQVKKAMDQAGDKELAKAVIKEFDAAPWTIFNLKGDGMPGWKPVQFEALMEVMSGVLRGGVDPIRISVLLKTGGGKTLLAFIGLLPLLEVNGRPTAFLTTQSNLEFQARQDLRAAKIVKSKVRIDTWSEFKNELAEGMLTGKKHGEYEARMGRSEDWNILGDEVDGAAKESVNSIGEENSKVSRNSGAYDVMKEARGKIRQTLRESAAREKAGAEPIKEMAEDIAGMLHQEDLALKHMARTGSRSGIQGNIITSPGKVFKSFKKVYGEVKANREQTHLDNMALKQIHREINEHVAGGQKGWRSRVEYLLKEEEFILSQTVRANNPIHDVFKRMKDSVEPIYNSVHRVKDSYQPAQEAPFRLNKMMEDGQAVMVKEVGAIEGRIAEIEAVQGATAEIAALRKTVSELKGELDAQATRWQAKRDELFQIYDDSLVTDMRTHERITEAVHKAHMESVKDGVLLAHKTQVVRDSLNQALAQPEIGPAAPTRAEILKSLGTIENELISRNGGSQMKAHKSEWAIQEARLAVTAGKNGAAVKTLNRLIDKLSVQYTRELLTAAWRDPHMTPGERWDHIWSLLPGLFKAKGSWAQKRLIALARAYGHDPDTVRLDNRTGEVNPVVIGNWSPTLDTSERIFHELEFGTPYLTMPLKHKSKASMNSIMDPPKGFRIVFSGTSDATYRKYAGDKGISVVGHGSEGALNPTWLMANSTQEIFGMPSKDGMHKAGVVSAALLKHREAAQFKDQPGHYDPEALVVYAVSGINQVKILKRFLLNAKGPDGKPLITKDQIALIFSDTEFLRVNRPQARVHRQMNLEGLAQGKVKVLILQTEVAGRGLDLDYRGAGSNGNFNGYKKFDMVIVDPQKMSPDLVIQVQGRIDVDRIPEGAVRNFTMVVDVRKAQEEALFKLMIEQNDFFKNLRRVPEVQRLAKARNLPMADWNAMHDYIGTIKAKAEPTAAEKATLSEYETIVKKAIADNQDLIAKAQYRHSSVINERSLVDDPRHNGLDESGDDE